MVQFARKRRGFFTRDNICRLGLMAGAVVAVMILLVSSIQRIGSLIDDADPMAPKTAAAAAATTTTTTTTKTTKSTPGGVSYKTPLAYGTKELWERTAELVEQAITTGFRHIVTSGHHTKHNETAVGIGWKSSGIPRQELFLQTCFVPYNKKKNHPEFQLQPSDPQPYPDSIEEQVKVSVANSLRNLQTDYIDAVIFQNFRASVWDTTEIHRAWTVLEEYVETGTIRQLGLSNVYDPIWFETFYNHTSVHTKPTILQNRFHSNRKYDVPMQEVFAKHSDTLWAQRFWVLNGSSGGGKANKATATQKNVTSSQLMLAFVMSMGSQTCLVGTKSLQHMKDDLDVARCHSSLFSDNNERLVYAKKLGMKLNKNNQEQPNSSLLLPGNSGIDFGNDESPKCGGPINR